MQPGSSLSTKRNRDAAEGCVRGRSTGRVACPTILFQVAFGEVKLDDNSIVCDCMEVQGLGKFLPISDPIEMATEIVAAFISRNSVTMAEVPGLIESVHAALSAAPSSGQGSAAVDASIPATSIRKSITPDYLICLDDGKRFKSLRRHLTLLGMTPEQYREKWGLPPDYPMVAANYATKRSELAKRIGLGQMRWKRVDAPAETPASRKVGRPSKKT